MQKEDRFFEGHHVRRRLFSVQKQVKTKKKVIKFADVHFSAQKRVKTKKKIYKKVIKSADVHVSAEKQVKTKKNVFTSADVHFSAQKQVKTLTLPSEKKHHVRRLYSLH